MHKQPLAMRTLTPALLIALTILSSCKEKPATGDLTRGIGVYPGNPAEYSGPSEENGGDAYRNVALRRAVHHSSSIDYNLTGHLITDGIVADSSPYYIEMVTDKGPMEKRDRERLFDDNTTSLTVDGSADAFLAFVLHNGHIDADVLNLTGSVQCDPEKGTGYDIVLEASENGTDWTVLKEFKGNDLPGTPRMNRFRTMPGAGSQNVAVSAGLGGPAAQTRPQMTPEMEAQIRRMMNNRMVDFSAPLPAGQRFLTYRIRLNAPCATTWTFQEMNFLRKGQEIKVLPSFGYFSAWMPEGQTGEWVYVDLGAPAAFDKVTLRWLEKPAGGVVEVSDDAASWKKVADLPQGDALVDEIAVSATARYVRLSGLDARTDGRISLTEMEVYGKGGLVPQPAPQPQAKGNRLYLSGGEWKLQRASEVTAEGGQIATEGFNPEGWIIATVPGSVATSYYNIGAIPDIRYDDDQLQISESFFLSDFWYRDAFELPATFQGKDLVLNFDGINWKADVYFNGTYVGHIDGAFTRGRFDVTSLAQPGTNYLAVKIYKNDNPGIIKEQNRITADTNGGVLGADNPTMHCSIGWDWIPTVRGRNIGIWNDVWLAAYDGGVSIDDIFVDTDLPLPSTDYADLKPTLTLTNHSDSPKNADIQLCYGPVKLAGEAVLAPGETRDVEIIPGRLAKPELWWPAGYGDQHLYEVTAEVCVDEKVSDSRTLLSGVREMSYTTDGGILDIYVNGRRLIGNGGNWGFPEINLNYRAREYDIAVAYHADMNYTMIRDWVGQTGDEEFYEACDRHGVMVWQDFWLANPADGPNPDDNDMFMANAEDYVRKIRNHPSIALYVGRNEGNPPEILNTGLEQLVKRLHPGMYYIPHSASGMVSGNGPYRALPVEDYFTAERGKDRLHSERGMPNVMTYESMTQMLRPEHQWPQNSVWGVHDYTLENAQSCATFNEMIQKAFGEPKDLKQFTQWAQWINYNGYRAMYESRSWNRKGLLIWMSHSCWPSMVWQTYDYYFEPTAAYFGVKKASAPIRIQWNPVSGQVEVVNNNASDQSGLTAYAAIVNYDGKVIAENQATLDSPEDTTTPLFPLTFDSPELSDVYYIKLRLTQGEKLLADNFYWEGKEDGNYRQLLTLPQVRLSLSRKVTCENGTYKMTATVKNGGRTPALMVRLKVQGKESGERILPVFYEDNYFSLLPGEEKTVQITFKAEDARGETPVLEMSGFNVKEVTK